MEEKNYFSCDYCHRVVTGITIVNGFKMCPMCLAEYQHKSGENNKLREELGRKIKEIEQLKKENEVYKIAWERFIDFFATKDCEWDAYESGGAIYGDAC